MKSTLTVEEGWKLIQEIGWGTKTTDYKAVAKKYFAKLGKKRMAQLHAFVELRRGNLYDAISEWECKHRPLDLGSDDGYSDLTYHIVGLGSNAFEQVLENPILAEERYRADEYKESFDYCFMEPDPSRTENQKKTELKCLFIDIAALEKKAIKLNDDASALRMEAQSLQLRALKVAADITAKE